MQLPEEILKKVKLVELNTRKLVNNLFAGEYHTAFKGQGMTFSEFREYVPGDDVRSIAWPLLARTGKPYIKKFDEERELTLILVVDISGSAEFGSGNMFKGEVMTYLSALLAFSAVRNKDQVGLVLFSNQVEHFVPPGKGHGHVQRILRDLFYFKPAARGTNISSAINYLNGILKKKSVVFIISDFLDTNFDKELRLLGQKHDAVSIVVNDKLELELPKVGVIELQDAETGEVILVDTESSIFRKSWQESRKKMIHERDKQLRQAQVDRIDIVSNENYAEPLVKYFKNRHGRN